MSKKIIYFAFVAFAIAGMSTVTSCRKGENDPLLSLKSRKARITGEWKLESGSSTSTTTWGGTTTTSMTTYTGSTRSANGFTYGYTETLTIEKDGTYKVEVVDDGDPYTVKGKWFFAGKIEDLDLKNKEAIVFVAHEYSSAGYIATYTGLYGGDVMMIDQLKNKEMIFKGESSYSGSGSSNSSNYDRTFEKQ